MKGVTGAPGLWFQPAQIWALMSWLLTFCQNKRRLNFDTFPDPGHGCWDDIKLSLKKSRHWLLVNIIMIAHNVTHGPFNEDARQGQVSQCVQHFCKTTQRASDSPLFMSFVDRMINAQGMDVDKGMPDIADVLLQKFKDDNPFTCKGAKVNYNRFMGAIKKGTEVAPIWPARAFGLVLTVCEAGLMTESKFKKMHLPEVATFAAGGGRARPALQLLITGPQLQRN